MKINNLLENITPTSNPDQGQGGQAPKFGRSDKVLEDDKVEESSVGTSVAGGMAPEATAVGGIQRRGKGSMLQGIKTSAKFPNSKAVKEDAPVADLTTGTTNQTYTPPSRGFGVMIKLNMPDSRLREAAKEVWEALETILPRDYPRVPFQQQSGNEPQVRVIEDLRNDGFSIVKQQIGSQDIAQTIANKFEGRSIPAEVIDSGIFEEYDPAQSSKFIAAATKAAKIMFNFVRGYDQAFRAELQNQYGFDPDAPGIEVSPHNATELIKWLRSKGCELSFNKKEPIEFSLTMPGQNQPYEFNILDMIQGGELEENMNTMRPKQTSMPSLRAWAGQVTSRYPDATFVANKTSGMILARSNGADVAIYDPANGYTKIVNPGGVLEARKANTKSARAGLSKREKAKPKISDKEQEQKKSESDRLWDMLQAHIAQAEKEKKLDEVNPQNFDSDEDYNDAVEADDLDLDKFGNGWDIPDEIAVLRNQLRHTTSQYARAQIENKIKRYEDIYYGEDSLEEGSGEPEAHDEFVSDTYYDSNPGDDENMSGQVNEKSKSKAQFRTMAAVANNPKFAKKVGISQKVGKEFHSADRKQDYKDLPAKVDEEGKGLWANIHAKRKRIKSGSGERMRKPGSKGAPSAQDFKDAANEAANPAQQAAIAIAKKKKAQSVKEGSEVDVNVVVGKLYDIIDHTENAIKNADYDRQVKYFTIVRDRAVKALDMIKSDPSNVNSAWKYFQNGEQGVAEGPSEVAGLASFAMGGGIPGGQSPAGIVDEAKVSEDKLAQDLYRDLQIFKKGTDKGISSKAKDRDIGNKPKDKDIVTKEDWQKTNKQDKTDGMSPKAVKAYRRENPGSKLKTAVTKKPSELKPGSKDAKRRKSFCARMSGNKGPMKDEKGRPTPKAKALRRWNCE